MKVVCYQNWFNQKHSEIVEEFADGVASCGVQVKLADVRNYQKADVAVIFGLVKHSYDKTWPKQKIIEKHQRDRSLVVIESGFIGRPEYYAIGWGGIHGNADFCISSAMSAKRFKQLGIKLWPWKQVEPFRVLVCGQVPWDTNVQDINYIKWCQTVVNDLSCRGYDVRFRPHPRLDSPTVYGIGKRFIDPNEKIQDSLQWAECVVVWNSTSAIDALIRGVPIITMGPDCMARSMGITTLEPKKVIRPDRRDFFNALGYTQWTREEMRKGLPWRHLNR